MGAAVVAVWVNETAGIFWEVTIKIHGCLVVQTKRPMLSGLGRERRSPAQHRAFWSMSKIHHVWKVALFGKVVKFFTLGKRQSQNFADCRDAHNSECEPAVDGSRIDVILVDQLFFERGVFGFVGADFLPRKVLSMLSFEDECHGFSCGHKTVISISVRSCAGNVTSFCVTWISHSSGESPAR